MEKKSPVIKNVVDAFRLLDVINEKGEVGIAQLSDVLDIPKTTVFRMVKTLEEVHVIKQLANSNYVLDFKLAAYAKGAVREDKLAEIATPFMNQICEMFDETVNLGILNDNQVIILKSVEGDFYQLQATLIPVSPLHSSGMGKLFLSEFSREKQAEYFEGITSRTIHTVVDVETFQTHVANIEETGISVDCEEYEYGLSCYAVPIYDINNKIICALSVSGPTSRLQHKGIDKLSEELKKQGNLLQQKIQQLM